MLITTLLLTSLNISLLPIQELTPGDILTKNQLTTCVSHYTETVRNVPESLKKEVFSEYNISYKDHIYYEVDHYIPLVLGGSNSIKNLWPQSKITKPYNAILKDKLEVKLHHMVCNGTITLEQAQNLLLKNNWISIYERYINNNMNITIFE